ASAETLWKNRKRMSVSDIRHSAGVPGLEPRLTEPESVVLPITPYPTACELLRSALGDVRKNSPGEGLRPKRIRGTPEVMPSWGGRTTTWRSRSVGREPVLRPEQP